jgi:antitoxin component of RelBE/YafQ-DinJ toxin-antitoxin module
MAKNARLTFRVQTELKKNLEAIAEREGRSVAQVCEAFLKAGLEEFRKRGPRYLQAFVSRSKQ